MNLPVAPRRIEKLDLAIEDYSFDFSPVLAAGDSVASAGNPVVRVGTVVAVKRSLVGNVLSVRLSGGTAGMLCEVIVQVTTASGAQPAHAFQVQITS